MPGSDTFEIYKKNNPDYTDTFVTTILKLKLSDLCLSAALQDCIPDIIFKGTLTKQPAIYSYFSAPVLNNKLSLLTSNGKRLPLFVNQTLADSSFQLGYTCICIP